MAEERRCEAPRLCANNCGFFGSPATQNLCSKCYRDLQLKEQQSSSAKLALNQSLTTAATSSSLDTAPLSIPLPVVDVAKSPEKESVSVGPSAATQPNKCATCRRRVGLTGFKCRCGMMFCGTHRYPEQHDCSFDYKGMEREAIAKANPVIKGKKIEKI